MTEEAELDFILEPGLKPKKFEVKKEFNLDYTKLEDDLRSAIESDQRYWLQNDAKLRAVQQPGTYEDFRQIVLGAHLKPMEKVDKITLDPNAPNSNRVIWNTAADSGNPDDPKLPGITSSQDPKTGKEYASTTTMRDFITIWKSMDTDERKFSYAVSLLELPKHNRTELLKLIFTDDLPLNELPEIISVLWTTLEKYETSKEPLNAPKNCFKILSIISECKRFYFSKVFLTQDDLVKLDSIFSKIENFLASLSDTSGCEDEQKFRLKFEDVKRSFSK